MTNYVLSILHNRLLSALGLAVIVFTLQSCGSDKDSNEINIAPEVVTALEDLTLNEGFSSETVALEDVFDDEDGDALTYTASSSDANVVDVSVSGSTLIIAEAGVGTATVSVTAEDGKGGSASDVFMVTVSSSGSTCSVDNSTSTDRGKCDVELPYASVVSIAVDEVADTRTIISNNIPEHMIGQFLNAEVTEQDHNFAMDYTPQAANEITPLLNLNKEYTGVVAAYEFGVALNGVKFDPIPNEPWENPETGEFNYYWNLEPTMVEIGLDCNEAHVQNSGAYHYHGVPSLYFDEIGVDGSGMVLVGWAGDGFPVYAQYGYADANDNTSAIVELTPSYQLRAGERAGDGISEPCGEYNGRYTNDYEYIEGLGDLDECNGRTGVTPEFPEGTYYYVITSNFPKQPRCWRGSPNADFKVFPR